MNKKIRILHLEDSLKDSELIRSLIESGGIEHEYLFAEDKKDFLRFLETENIDLILSDYHLPGYNGNEALKAAKKKYSHIPFIFVSGMMGEDAAINSLLNGATDYVLKNKPERLVPAIKRAIHETEIEQARIQAEEDLRVSRARLERAQRVAQMGFMDWDLKTNNIYWSDEICRMYGVEPGENIQTLETTVELVHPEDRDFAQKHLEMAIKGEKDYDIDHRILRLDGKVFWVHAQAELIRDEDGTPVSLLGSVVDITERKQAEKSLQESEEKFRAITTSAQDAIIMIDNEGNISFWNESAERLFGYSHQEALGIEIHTLLAPHRYHEAYKKGIKNFKMTGEGPVIGKTLELEALKKDGTEFPIELSVSAVKINSVWNSIGIIRDITERKRTEKELIKAKEIAEENLFSLNEAQEIAKMGSWEQDLVTMKGKWSKNCFVLFGYKPFEFESTFDHFKRIVHPDDWHIIEDGLNICIRTKETTYSEVRIVLPDGTIKWLYNSANPIFYEDKLVALKGTNIDITERKQFEQKLENAKEKALESDRLKSAFLANMSHEIRTPMIGILGFADLLKEPELSGEQQQQYIQIIEKSGARMLNIINDIVSISKIEAGIIEVHLTETKINNQLQFIYDTLKLDAKAKKLNLSFTCGLSEKDAIIKTDSEKFYGILTNLVKNAIKYTDTGAIEFGYTYSENEFEFYVKDTGIGIPKGRHDAIFERFIQADIADKMARQGAGLGLAISREYAKMLGGKIWVESEEGMGSTFFFALPSNKLADKNITANQLSENESKIVIPENLGLKVLIVEDDEASEMLISIELKKYSREIRKVINGLDAIEICRNNPNIDLVLMDIQMPKINGYQATREIRKFNKNVVIIAQTAFALIGDREKAIEAGCNDYITKPINKMELQAMIQKYFEK
ncbi:MAG: PAS domain S-box protein [Bacteroidetes bacterium]|nr:PAS domain S-box protein [Bacteroidota bacterium]